MKRTRERCPSIIALLVAMLVLAAELQTSSACGLHAGRATALPVVELVAAVLLEFSVEQAWTSISVAEAPPLSRKPWICQRSTRPGMRSRRQTELGT